MPFRLRHRGFVLRSALVVLALVASITGGLVSSSLPAGAAPPPWPLAVTPGVAKPGRWVTISVQVDLATLHCGSAELVTNAILPLGDEPVSSPGPFETVLTDGRHFAHPELTIDDRGWGQALIPLSPTLRPGTYPVSIGRACGGAAGGLFVASNIVVANPEPLGTMPTLIGDRPLAGDWDGDGDTTIGVYRDGLWYLRNSNSAGGIDISFGWGQPGDVPIVGDWDGDGDTTIGVFRSGQWYLRNTNTGGGVDVSFTWGLASDLPISGDWDGDGDTTIGVFRSGQWYLRNSNTGGGVDATFVWGSPADLPLVGDWDGNQTATPGIRRGDVFFQRNSNSAGGVDATFSWGQPTITIGPRPVIAPVPGLGLDPVSDASARYFPPGSPCLSLIDSAVAPTSISCTTVGATPYRLIAAIGGRDISPTNRVFSGGVYALAGDYAVPLFTVDPTAGTYSGMTAIGADLTGDTFPEMLFGVRVAGTGQILQYNVLGGFPYLYGVREVYKGVLERSGTDLLEYQPVYAPGEPNCCPSGRERLRVRVLGDHLGTVERVPVPLDSGGPSIL